MNQMDTSQDFDSYEIEEPSDEERAESSSEDELDILLNGTPQQKKKLIREYLTGESESSSGDEFEKEMEAELSCTIRSLEGGWGPTTANVTAQSSGGGANPQTYDKIYFDSDSDEEDTPSSSTGRRRGQRTVLTNDELLYDPDEDDRDQAWVDAKRREYQSRRRPPGGGSRSRSQGLATSDAVLNCPACMTTLCLDCQRHEKYRTQYRAMFVMNCIVKKDEVLRYKTEPDRKKTRKNRKRKAPATEPESRPGLGPGPESGPGLGPGPESRPGLGPGPESRPGLGPGPESRPGLGPGPESGPGLNQGLEPGPQSRPGLDPGLGLNQGRDPGLNQRRDPGLNQCRDPGLNQDLRADRRPAGMDSEELYYPVQCSECSTEVAVFDKDEVYHFFNILASHC